jgi:hypothetical protein
MSGPFALLAIRLTFCFVGVGWFLVSVQAIRRTRALLQSRRERMGSQPVERWFLAANWTQIVVFGAFALFGLAIIAYGLLARG